MTELVTRYRSPSAFEFAAEQCADLAKGGMFVRTGAPPPVGTLLKLECDTRSEDEAEPIRGVGRVVWTRTAADPPLGPTGMGIKFVKLEPGSEELIRRVLDEYGSSLDPHGEQRRLSGFPDEGARVEATQVPHQEDSAEAPDTQAVDAAETAAAPDAAVEEPRPEPVADDRPTPAAPQGQTKPGVFRDPAAEAGAELWSHPMAEPAPAPASLFSRNRNGLLMVIIAAIVVLGAVITFQGLRTNEPTPAKAPEHAAPQ